MGAIIFQGMKEAKKEHAKKGPGDLA